MRDGAMSMRTGHSLHFTNQRSSRTASTQGLYTPKDVLSLLSPTAWTNGQTAPGRPSAVAVDDAVGDERQSAPLVVRQLHHRQDALGLRHELDRALPGPLQRAGGGDAVAERLGLGGAGRPLLPQRRV